MTRLWGMLLALLLCVPAQAEDLPLFRLEMKDGQLIPARLVVPAGKRFKIDIINSGKSAAEFESLPLRKEKVLGPGAQSFVVFNPLSPGEYPFFDEFHQPAAKGVLIVK